MLGENSSPSTIVAYIYSDNEVDDTVTDPQHSSLAISATSKLRKVVDYTTNPTTVQTYVYNNLGEVESVQSGALTQTVESKDFANRPTRVSRKFNNVQCMVNTYTYRDIVSNALQSEKVEYYLNSSVQTDYTYDGLGRTQQTALHSNISNAGVTTKYTYVPRQEKQQSPIGDSGVGITPTQPFVTVTVGTTPLVGNVKRYLTVGSTETLLATEDVEYDSCGNITKYGDTTFVYDKLNRLVRENNKTIDKTIVWEYDVSGNVTSRREYAYTEGAVGTQTGSCSFGYNHATHKDWLTSFVGIPITYDAMGNPTSYKGTTFGWSRGRLLTSATQGSKSISMGYNIDGVRCNKTVITGSGVVSNSYHYEGANLMHEVVTKNGTTTNRKYLYNSQGIVGFIQNDVEYIYHKNIFGDIVAIYQGATKVAEYIYDAWGNHKVLDGNSVEVTDPAHIAHQNPFRYRGYYFDTDLGLYYLMSRYYDPQTGRFIQSADVSSIDASIIDGLNLYAYALNNPVKSLYNNSRSSANSFYENNASGTSDIVDYNMSSEAVVLPSLYEIMSATGDLISLVHGLKVAHYISQISGNPPETMWFFKNLGNLDKISNYLGYATAIVDGIYVYSNTKDGWLSFYTVAYDLLAIGIAKLSLRLICSLITGPAGAIIGTLVSIAIGIALQYYKEDVVVWASQNTHELIYWISNGGGQLANA